MSQDGDGRDPDATDTSDDDTELDCSSPFSFMSSWHGTHVSGIIAASTNNGLGIAGVSPESRLVPVRALGHEHGRPACGWHGAPLARAGSIADPAQVGNRRYSASTEECLAFQKQIEWRFDGCVWSAALPNVTCPRGSRMAVEMQAIDSRGYNLRTLIDPDEIMRMERDGWTGRRIAFCVPE